MPVFDRRCPLTVLNDELKALDSHIGCRDIVSWGILYVVRAAFHPLVKFLTADETGLKTSGNIELFLSR
jgi:hypothetical protein